MNIEFPEDGLVGVSKLDPAAFLGHLSFLAKAMAFIQGPRSSASSRSSSRCTGKKHRAAFVDIAQGQWHTLSALCAPCGPHLLPRAPPGPSMHCSTPLRSKVGGFQAPCVCDCPSSGSRMRQGNRLSIDGRLCTPMLKPSCLAARALSSTSGLSPICEQGAGAINAAGCTAGAASHNSTLATV